MKKLRGYFNFLHRAVGRLWRCDIASNDECGGAIGQWADQSIETKGNIISFNSHQVMTIIVLVTTRNTNARASQSNMAAAHSE